LTQKCTDKALSTLKEFLDVIQIGQETKLDLKEKLKEYSELSFELLRLKK